MKYIALAAALAFGVVFLAPSADAQDQQLVSDLGARNIDVEYYAPRDPSLVPLYQLLQKRGVLEELGQFLAPAQWPHTLHLIAKQCPAVSGPERPQVFYDDIEYSLIVCYNTFAFLNKMSPERSFATKQEVVVGGLVGLVLTAGARAAFDMLQVPVLGSPEDAADQLAGFVALQFGSTVARTVVKGLYQISDQYQIELNNAPYNFAAGSSVAPQREQNILCIAYGGDPKDFKDFVDKGLLARSRAPDCVNEYNQIKYAFGSTIKPHVDQSLMNKALSLTWITPGDLKSQ